MFAVVKARWVRTSVLLMIAYRLRPPELQLTQQSVLGDWCVLPESRVAPEPGIGLVNCCDLWAPAELTRQFRAAIDRDFAILRHRNFAGLCLNRPPRVSGRSSSGYNAWLCSTANTPCAVDLLRVVCRQHGANNKRRGQVGAVLVATCKAWHPEPSTVHRLKRNDSCVIARSSLSSIRTKASKCPRWSSVIAPSSPARPARSTVSKIGVAASWPIRSTRSTKRTTCA